jgi:hypothetical protein
MSELCAFIPCLCCSVQVAALLIPHRMSPPKAAKAQEGLYGHNNIKNSNSTENDKSAIRICLKNLMSVKKAPYE